MSGGVPERTLRSPSDDSAPTLALSDEPLIVAVHAHFPLLLLAVCLTAIVYICLIPFDFTLDTTRLTGRRFLGLGLEGNGIADVLANIAYYLPPGAFAYGLARRRGLRRWSAALAVLAGGAAMSFAIEFAQRYVQPRVPAWSDWTANVLGTVIGTALATCGEARLRRMLAGARSALRANGWGVIAKVAVCGVLLVELRPYDVVANVPRAVGGLRHADLRPWARWEQIGDELAAARANGKLTAAGQLERQRWEYALDRAADIGVYAALAALCALGHARTMHGRPARLYLWSGFVCVCVASLVTVVRVFLRTYGLDTAHLACSVIAWPLGCAVAGRAVGLVRHATPSDSDRTSPVIGPTATTMVIAVVAALILAYEVIPFDVSPDPIRTVKAHVVTWVPLTGQWNASIAALFLDVSGKLLRYGALGACLAAGLRRRSRRAWRVQLVLTSVTVAWIVGMSQFLHLFMPSRSCDMTNVVLGMMGGFVGAVFVRWQADYRACLAVRVVDDPLTRQLTEAPARQVKAVRSPRSRRSDASPKGRVESRRRGGAEH